MRFIAFQRADRSAWGAVHEDGSVTDLSRLFPSLTALVAAGDDGMAALTTELEKGIARQDVAAIELLAPIPVPVRNVFCVGWNYPRHFEEGVGRRGGQETEKPSHPNFFTKSTTSVIGPGATIPLHAGFTSQLDYEGELAVIIGRGGKDISEEEALSHVFGYSLANDVTARDVQHRTGVQWFKGKSMDGSCPLGPTVVTTDEIPDPQALRITCRVNGEVRQEAPTSIMVFSVARLISELSLAMTLLPGDILLTGTPPGVGWGMTPPRFLGPGDLVEVEIGQVGVLGNRVG